MSSIGRSEALALLRLCTKMISRTSRPEDLPISRLGPHQRSLHCYTQRARLEEVPRLAPEILKGHVRGRVVVDVNGEGRELESGYRERPPQAMAANSGAAKACARAATAANQS